MLYDNDYNTELVNAMFAVTQTLAMSELERESYVDSLLTYQCVTEDDPQNTWYDKHSLMTMDADDMWRMLEHHGMA